MMGVFKHSICLKLQFKLELDPSVAYQESTKTKPEHNKSKYTLEVVIASTNV